MPPFAITQKVKTIPHFPYETVKNDILGKKYSLSLSFVGPTRAQKLNVQYRKKTSKRPLLPTGCHHRRNRYLSHSCPHRTQRLQSIRRRLYHLFVYSWSPSSQRSRPSYRYRSERHGETGKAVHQ
jgi:hypothetical protein